MLQNQNLNRPTAGSPAVAAAATIRDYYPNLANVLATLLAVLARPAQARQPASSLDLMSAVVPPGRLLVPTFFRPTTSPGYLRAKLT